MTNLRNEPLSQILRSEKIYNLFYEEFSKEQWLDASVLLQCECSADELIDDGSVPKTVMLRIVDRLDNLDSNA